MTGPWTKIADEAKLAASGSALAVGSGYGVGVQAWYNQDLAVDPANPDHVYAGLEEVFESTDAGSTWVTASPYWNYGLACDDHVGRVPQHHAPGPARHDDHRRQDRHRQRRRRVQPAAVGRPAVRRLDRPERHPASTGSTTTPGPGRSGRTTAVWGGLQDNGTSVLIQGRGQMAEPAGGDGFYVIVDPRNANRMVGEYTDGAMYSSTDGGHTFADYVSPTCAAQAHGGNPRDPGLRSRRPVRDPAGPGPAEHQRVADRRPVRVGQQGRLEHQLHRFGLLVAERLRHRDRQRGDRALLHRRRQGHLRRLGGRRRQPRARRSPPASPPTTAAAGTR